VKFLSTLHQFWCNNALLWFKGILNPTNEERRRLESCRMWLEKIFAGVLRVLTPLGARYIQPSLAQRLYLLWIFRHFQVLPLQVLTPGQRRFMDALCVEPRFVSPMQANGVEAPILGTLERRPPVKDLPQRPSTGISGAVSPFAPSPYNAERRS
jgi:hypothetical protein